MKEPNLQSSLIDKGEFVTQIFHFVGGIKRTFKGIKTETIRQGQFTKLECKNGATLMINDSNILMVEVFVEE
jgi:hypothetical protein